jgi:asparagine synthetase B (glutamine-hydrolysing)
MCSIGVTNTSKSLLESNMFSQQRGPDETTIVKVNNIQFLHNLLHLTGEKTTQPFIKNNVVVVFNGEIYNYSEFGNYKTDGECLIDLYEKHGTSFTKLLDGEFAICLVDFKQEILLISTDTFACKPLWYEFKENEFCIASYNSQLSLLEFKNSKKLYANTTKVYNLYSYKEIDSFENFKFDIRQYKNNFDDWNVAFENSIRKRTTNIQYGVFLGLSSGYDSGAIACELLKQNVKFKSYTIAGPENIDIVNKRVNLISEYEIIYLTRSEYDSTHSYIVNNCEDFYYHDKYLDYNIKGDKASYGLAAICSRAVNEKRRIYLSGQGADEIISDYGYNGNKIYAHSSFGGKVPDSLHNFWPWHSFYDGTQIQYLNKEEYIAGHYGIETRYPFLDKYVVQEFLWLNASLKNSKYKSVLNNYLSVNGFPFKEEKIGFNTLKNLK